MIANVLSLIEMTKKARVTFDSVDGDSFKVHIGDNIVKVLANNDGLYLSIPDKKFFRKVAE